MFSVWHNQLMPVDHGCHVCQASRLTGWYYAQERPSITSKTNILYQLHMCPKLWLAMRRHCLMLIARLHNLMYCVNVLFTSSANGIAFYCVFHSQACAEITRRIRTMISRRHSLKGFSYLYENRCVCLGSDRSPSSCLFAQGVFTICAPSSHR